MIVKRLSILHFVIALLGCTLITTSCTNQDALFASDLIPEAQGMGTLVDSSLTLKTSLLHIDSVATSGTSGVMFLGSIWNPIIGKSTSQVISNYVAALSIIPDGEFLFGKDPKLDSMYMTLVFDNCKGDTTHKLKVSVHELKDTVLNYHSTYYSNFKVDNYYTPTALGEFTISGGVQNLKQHLPREYFDRLLYNNKDRATNPILNDTLFVKLFKGFYFKVENPVIPPTQGAMYRLNLKSSSLHLHFHNANEKPDTTSYSFKFYQIGSPTVSFYTVENDFTVADPSRGGIDARQINDSTIQVPTVFVTGMVGLGARVVIDTTYLNNLVKKANDAGYRKVAIQRAALRWHFNDATPENYLWAPKRFGLYYNFVKSNPVPDYEAAREDYATASGQAYSSDIGGYINRSNGYYEQVITSTIQRLINKNPNASNIVQLLPTTGEVVSYGYAQIGGSTSANKQPTVVLVYTMIR